MLIRHGTELKLDCTHKVRYRAVSMKASRRFVEGEHKGQTRHRPRRPRVRGIFRTALDGARRHAGGMGLLRHYIAQPWETWHEL